MQCVLALSGKNKLSLMKRLTFPLTGFLGLALSTAFAANAPRGDLIEVHSCEVYAGGCVVSSESPQSSGYMLRAWNFTGGTFAGNDLGGLNIAVLQVSSDNLAAPGSKSGDAVVYLPEAATPAQREALMAWLKSQPDFHPSKTLTRVAPLTFSKGADGYTFSAGNVVSIKTAPFQRCELFSCGEELWYQPRAATGVFTVAVNSGSRVSEPLLQLNWKDSGKRSVFLARFGEPDSPKQIYVSTGELCGTPAKVL